MVNWGHKLGSDPNCFVIPDLIRVHLLALRSQTQPLWGVGTVLTLYRLAVWPVRTLLNLWVRVFFLGGAPIDYSAANIVAVLRKTG